MRVRFGSWAKRTATQAVAPEPASLLPERALQLVGDIEARGRAWFWEVDAEGHLTYLSAAFLERVGSVHEEFLGRELLDVFEGEDGPEVDSQLDFAMRGKLPFSDLSFRRRAGGEAWALSGVPTFDAVGRLLGYRGTGIDLNQGDKLAHEAAQLATVDPLTGLSNRLLMRRTLDQALKPRGVQRAQCGFLLLDLDRFKSVNDTLGHPVGDALLKQVAARLERAVGELGRVGRLGGDEFNVVVPDTADRDRLGELAETIISRLSLPYEIQGSAIDIGCSVGLAISPVDGDCPDELVRNADLALYAAKAAGKGVHRFYQPQMHAEAKDRRLLEIDLREMLNGNELQLAYQPVVDAETSAVDGFEALVRWNHPIRGLVSPNEFIPVAEEIGLLPIIGEWVLRTACHEAMRWPDNLRVAVNLSPLQFASPGLPTLVLNALSAAGLAPDRLELELTEGVLLNDSPQIDATFKALKAIGVRLALDDFGTGYASLSTLRRAPFDRIKIDQSFVRGAKTDGSINAEIIRATVGLARSLGMQTTAEGVETPDEVDLIRSLGCSQIQGYIFGEPMSANEALERAERARPQAVEREFVEREPRLSVLRFANLKSAGETYPVRIRNLSAGGATIEIDRRTPVHEEVEIELSDTRCVSGKLRWMDGGRIGVAFDERIDADAVRREPSVSNRKRPRSSAA